MNWLTLDLIKQHLRLDDAQANAESGILTIYGNSSERAVLNLLRRTTDDLVEAYGEVPLDLVHASLMLVEIAYQHRSSITSATVNLVGYTFDVLIKPYMRLAGDDDGGSGGDLPEGSLMDSNGTVLADSSGAVLCA